MFVQCNNTDFIHVHVHTIHTNTTARVHAQAITRFNNNIAVIVNISNTQGRKVKQNNHKNIRNKDNLMNRK